MWLSDIGVLGVLGGLGLWASKTSAAFVGLAYGLPYLFLNAWLVAYTWLQAPRAWPLCPDLPSPRSMRVPRTPIARCRSNLCTCHAQHTDVDVPHLPASEFSFIRGAFLSIDRPYGKVRHPSATAHARIGCVSRAFPHSNSASQAVSHARMMLLMPFLNRMGGDPLVTCHQVFDWLHHRIGSTHVAHHIDCTIPHYHAREVCHASSRTLPSRLSPLIATCKCR